MKTAFSRRFVSAASFILAATLFATAVHADVLTGDIAFNQGSYYLTDGTGPREFGFVGPLALTNHTTNTNFIAYCGDFRVSTSTKFDFGGELYVPYSLFAQELTQYTFEQKVMIDTLFSYTYSSAMNVETGLVKDRSLSQAIQLALWEILTEEGTTGYDILGGTFKVDPYNYYAGRYDYALTDTANQLLSALTGNITWESLGYTEKSSYEMTVYVAGDGSVSQTMVSITSSPNNVPATPEPASMLIFGLGLVAGVPMLRKRLQKK